MNSHSVEISPTEANDMIERGDAVLIDIRDPSEYAREHIPGARLVPLDRLGQADFSAARDKTTIFHCFTGGRTRQNLAMLEATGLSDIRLLEGGLQNWKACGFASRVNPKAPIDLMRQVQITAGTLVVIGALLGVSVSPWWIGLSAFVGAGLLFAGLTGTCGMARLLSVMPWNRRNLGAAA